jgi:uncharacterized phage protein gp47/JayE
MDDYSDLYQQMLDYYCSATRHTPDQASDIAIRIQVLAAQLEKLVSQAREVERDAFPATAVGEALEHHAALRGLTRKEGTKAGCTVIFRRPAAGYSLVIPVGTLLQTGGTEALRYVTRKNITMSASATTAVCTVDAVEAGSVYNVKAGNITVMVTPPQGVTEVAQLTDCVGGSDPEGDESLRARLLDSCRHPGVGGSPGYYRELMLSQQEVGKAKVIPTFRGRGTVDLVVYGIDGTLSEYQLGILQELFQEQRELGVDVLVRSPQTTPVNLELSLAVETGWDFGSVSAAVEEALREEMEKLDIGAPWLLARMNRVVMEVPGVYNCIVTLPAADTFPLEDGLLVPSGITIHTMEVSV